jgi:hypothetical protein
MSYISNSIDKAIDLTDRAFKASAGYDDKFRILISDIYVELSGIKTSLKLEGIFDKRLHTLDDLSKQSRLLDLLYE